jgi:hypothetical protein
MAIGLGILRAAGRGRRTGRVDEDRGSPRSTVREVCLIGVDRRSPAEDWTAGREVTWLGRTYRVRATAGEGPEAPAAGDGDAHVGPIGSTARRYVYLTPSGGG